MSQKRRVAVIGGGITGLTTAFRLLEKGADRFSVTLVERDPKLGGKIRTLRENGCVLDGGPDAFVAAKPQATELSRDLGIADRLIDTVPENRRVYIRRGGRLVLMPEGLVLGIPTEIVPLATSSLFSLPGVLRMGLDLVIPQRSGDEDETIASFFRRRLGREALDRLAEPLLGGIYAGDPEKLSIRSTFPQLVELEKKHRSLVIGMLRTRAKARAKAPPSAFHSFKTGMGDLVDALERKIRALGGSIRLETSVKELSRKPDGTFSLALQRSESAETIEADEVVLASTLPSSSNLLSRIEPTASRLLGGVEHVSTATCLIAFSKKDMPRSFNAVGVVLPKKEGTHAMALTFVTSKWEERSPNELVVLRVFLGGYVHQGDLSRSDEELVTLARRELAEVLGLRAEPQFARIFRYPSGSPQPWVGHEARMKSVKAAIAGVSNVHLAGSSIDGVGIPDCVRQANSVARTLLALPPMASRDVSVSP